MSYSEQNYLVIFDVSDHITRTIIMNRRRCVTNCNGTTIPLIK